MHYHPVPIRNIHFEHLSDLKGIYKFSYLSVDYESSVKFFIIDFTSDNSMTGGNMVLVVQERMTYWTNDSPSEFGFVLHMRYLVFYRL